MIMKVKNKNLSSELIKDIPIMKKQGGFTLVEVLIALAVFSVGVLAIAALQVTAIRGNSLSSHLTEATTLAGDRIETLMNLEYSAAATDPLLQETSVDGLLASEEVAADHWRPFTSESSNVTYNVSWNIAPDAATSALTVRVIVTWTEGVVQRSFALDFVKAQA